MVGPDSGNRAVKAGNPSRLLIGTVHLNPAQLRVANVVFYQAYLFFRAALKLESELETGP